MWRGSRSIVVAFAVAVAVVGAAGALDFLYLNARKNPSSVLPPVVNPGEDLPFEHIAPASGLALEAGYRVFQDQTNWSRFWQEHVLICGIPEGCPSLHPPPPLPNVDFYHQTVIVLSVGWRSTSGYGVVITAVNLTGHVLRVDAREYDPGKGCAVNSLYTTWVYDIVKVPKVIPTYVYVALQWTYEDCTPAAN